MKNDFSNSYATVLDGSANDSPIRLNIIYSIQCKSSTSMHSVAVHHASEQRFDCTYSFVNMAQNISDDLCISSRRKKKKSQMAGRAVGLERPTCSSDTLFIPTNMMKKG